MPTPKSRKNHVVEPTGFDVTCVVGRVEFDANGDMTPHQAAFRLIADQDMQGTYQFPARDGRTIEVQVNYIEDPFQHPGHRESLDAPQDWDARP